MYLRGWERITPPCLAFAHSFFTSRQKIRTEDDEEADHAETIAVRQRGCEVTLPKLRSNAPGTLRNMYR
jgi:hypothetical protein